MENEEVSEWNWELYLSAEVFVHMLEALSSTEWGEAEGEREVL